MEAAEFALLQMMITDMPDGLDTVDPSLGGLSSSGATDGAGQATRVVLANETLMNQSDNPVLQRSVAKYILGAVSAADASTWMLRDLSRGSHGWTFTYICKDSHQYWYRQTAKNPSQAVIGEYSLQEPDPVLMARPAFDCRGCALVSFNRSSRSITVKYDHTLLHKTVGQLSELFPPPQRQLGPGAQKILQQKTPKKSTSEQKEKGPASEKKSRAPSKKRQSQAGDETGQQPKKRRRKKKQDDVSAEGHADHQGPSQAMAPSWPEQPAHHQLLQSPGQSYGEYSSGNANDSAAAQHDPSGKPLAPQNGSAPTLLPLNVSADEAARRQTVAGKLLSDAGVNPDSLSTEQMNIFSNQGPDLQKDSIAMLAKYGAERLHIIHPQNNDKSKSTDSTSASSAAAQTAQTAPSASGLTTTKELSLQSGADVSEVTNGVSMASGSKGKGSSRSKRGLGKSRHACSECKSRKTKCPKERPVCSECQSSRRHCQYPPPKPRSRKSAALVVEDEEDDEDADDDDDDDDDNDRTMEPEHNPQPEHPAPSLDHQLPAEDVAYPQMPVAGMLTPYTEQPAAGSHTQDPSYFQSESGLSMPPPDMNTMSHQPLPATSGLALPQGQPYSHVEPSVDTTPVYQQTGPLQPTPQTASPKSKKRQPRGSGSASRRPLAQSQPAQPVNPPTPSSSTSWMAANTSAPSSTARENTVSPIYAQSNANQQRPRVPKDRMQNNSPRVHNSSTTHQQQVPSPQQPAHVVAAMQSQSRKSPFPGHQRAASRQGRSSQSRTPNAEQAMNRGYRPPPSQTQPTNFMNVSASSSNHAQASNLSSNPTYEPLSPRNALPTTSTHSSYDYSRTAQTSSSAMNPAITSTANQWPTSTQSSQARSYDNRPGNYGSNSYSQTRNMTQPAASVHNFDMRSAIQPQTKSSASDIKQQTYSQYPSQLQAHQQPAQQADSHHMNQNPEWYGFNSGNTNSFTSANPGWM